MNKPVEFIFSTERMEVAVRELACQYSRLVDAFVDAFRATVEAFEALQENEKMKRQKRREMYYRRYARGRTSSRLRKKRSR